MTEREELLSEAAEIRALFAKASSTGVKDALRQRYKSIDKLLGEHPHGEDVLEPPEGAVVAHERKFKSLLLLAFVAASLAVCIALFSLRPTVTPPTLEQFEKFLTERGFVSTTGVDALGSGTAEWKMDFEKEWRGGKYTASILGRTTEVAPYAVIMGYMEWGDRTSVNESGVYIKEWMGELFPNCKAKISTAMEEIRKGEVGSFKSRKACKSESKQSLGEWVLSVSKEMHAPGDGFDTFRLAVSIPLWP